MAPPRNPLGQSSVGLGKASPFPVAKPPKPAPSPKASKRGPYSKPKPPPKPSGLGVTAQVQTDHETIRVHVDKQGRHHVTRTPIPKAREASPYPKPYQKPELQTPSARRVLQAGPPSVGRTRQAMRAGRRDLNSAQFHQTHAFDPYSNTWKPKWHLTSWW